MGHASGSRWNQSGDIMLAAVLIFVGAFVVVFALKAWDDSAHHVVQRQVGTVSNISISPGGFLTPRISQVQLVGGQRYLAIGTFSEWKPGDTVRLRTDTFRFDHRSSVCVGHQCLSAKDWP